LSPGFALLDAIALLRDGAGQAQRACACRTRARCASGRRSKKCGRRRVASAASKRSPSGRCRRSGWPRPRRRRSSLSTLSSKPGASRPCGTTLRRPLSKLKEASDLSWPHARCTETAVHRQRGPRYLSVTAPSPSSPAARPKGAAAGHCRGRIHAAPARRIARTCGDPRAPKWLKLFTRV